MRYVATIAIALLCLACVARAEDKDSGEFCRYQMEQAMAQRDLLRTPSVVAGVTQPETGLPMQAIWGLSNSLSSDKKAGLTMAVARKGCELYQKTTEAQQKIQFAMNELEATALNHRLDLIQATMGKLDGLIAETSKRLKAQDLTRPDLYALQDSRLKLVEDDFSTKSKIAALYAPPLSETPIRLLISQKQNSEVENQKAIVRLGRQSNWDVALAVGVHRQINSFAPAQDEATLGAYGQVNITLNSGTKSIDRHLDRAADAYGDWKLNQVGDVVQNAAILKKQVSDSIAVEETTLAALQEHEKVIEANLEVVQTVDTTAGLEFKNRLTVDQMLLRIEVDDATFRKQALQQFIQENF